MHTSADIGNFYRAWCSYSIPFLGENIFLFSLYMDLFYLSFLFLARVKISHSV